MLGYVIADGRGKADLLIREVAMRLHAGGVRVAGAVQVNIETDANRKCHMDLHILTGDDVVRISQDLGAMSRGCRLDPGGLERAVGLVSAELANNPQIVIINKFGKQELEGRGFRPVIGEALSAGIPVLTAVNRSNLDGFLEFGQDFAQPVPNDAEALLDWAMVALKQSAAE